MKPILDKDEQSVVALGMLKAAGESFAQPAFQSVVDWAEENRWLPDEVTAKPGPYRLRLAPYQGEPQESFHDRGVQTTVLMWAKRLGKTEIFCNLIGQTVCKEPRNILVAYPTMDKARTFASDFVMPMVRSTPDLNWRIQEPKQRGAYNTVRRKAYPGGNMAFVSVKARGALRQVQAPVVLLDEVDAMDDGPEGDPILLAFGRTENYSMGIQAMASTPTIKGHSKIESWYEQSDKRCWFVTCLNPECSGGVHAWILQWSNVRWPDGKPQEAWLECPFCGRRHDDADRVKMIRAGRWKATAPFRGVRGFWLNGLNSPFPAKKGYISKLHQFAQEFLDAKAKGPSGIQTWTNEFLAETFEAIGEQHETTEFTERLEPYKQQPLPDGVLCLVLGADIHPDRIEAEIVGLGVGMETWGIARAKLLGDTMLRGVWDKFFEFADQRFKHECGAYLRVVRAHIDSGASTPGLTKQVYRFCASSGRPWYAIKGSPSQLKEPVIEMRKRSRALLIDTIYFKNQIHEWLKVLERGPRFCHFPTAYDEEYFAQLCAEKRTVRFSRGRPVYTWEVVRPNGRNEAWDIRVYAASAAYVVNPNWDKLIKWRDEERAKNKPQDGDSNPTPAAVVPGPATPPVPSRTRIRVGVRGIGLPKF